MYVCAVFHFMLNICHACFVSEVGSCQIPLFHPYLCSYLHLKGPPIGLGGERFPARRLFGILMGFSWENCPQNRPLHRCLCFRSAVLRVRECVRYNPVWRNHKYTSNFCFDVSLRTLEVEHFFFSPQNILPLLLHNKKHRNGYIYYVKFLSLNFMTVINKKTYWLKWGVISTWGLGNSSFELWERVTMMPITTGFSSPELHSSFPLDGRSRDISSVSPLWEWPS